MKIANEFVSIRTLNAHGRLSILYLLLTLHLLPQVPCYKIKPPRIIMCRMGMRYICLFCWLFRSLSVLKKSHDIEMFEMNVCSTLSNSDKKKVLFLFHILQPSYYRRLQITICFWVWHCHGWLLHRADALRATYRKYKSSFLNSVDSSWLTSHLRYSHIILYFSLIDFYGQVIVYLKKNWGRWIRIWHSFNSFKSLGDAAAYFFVHSSIKLKTWIQRFSRALSSIVAFFSLKKIHWGR